MPGKVIGAVAASSHFMDFVMRKYLQEYEPQRIKKTSINRKSLESLTEEREVILSN